uniref:Ig-like domain-containing protein n=1 Tax=Erpetoichthys calabaricus TaxID=27687 RepID=A0A8C4T1E9_ERPCA
QSVHCDEVRRPGESLRLTCQGSGQDRDGDSIAAYRLYWFQQVPGKGLEWLADISSKSDDIDYASNIKGRLTLSRDNSKQAGYLDMNNLKTEDTATYYCATGTVRKFLLFFIHVYRHVYPKYLSSWKLDLFFYQYKITIQSCNQL